MTIKEQYRKERRRVTQLARRMKNRGYILPENAIPDIPKNITAGSVRRLQKITASALQEKSRFIDTDTGEIVSGKKGRNIERQRASRKGRETVRKKKAFIDLGDITIEEPEEPAAKIPKYGGEGIDPDLFDKLKDLDTDNLGDIDLSRYKEYIENAKQAIQIFIEDLGRLGSTKQAKNFVSEMLSYLRDSMSDNAGLLGLAAAIQRTKYLFEDVAAANGYDENANMRFIAEFNSALGHTTVTDDYEDFEIPYI